MTHQLPDDPKAVVIRWESAGGLAGEDTGPDLTVRADGTVSVGPRLGGGRTLEGRITAAELQELLRFALDDNDFFAFDPEQVAREVEAAAQERARSTPGEALAVPAGPPYVDAGTTTILLAADGRRHEVSYHGLFAAAKEHPESRPLAQLRAIELRLLELAQRVAAGGG